MHELQKRGEDVAAKATPMNTTSAVRAIAATVTPRLVRRKFKDRSQLMALGLGLWTARRWQRVHWNPLECRRAVAWQRVHTVLEGSVCRAWYLPAWQVRQFLTDLLTALACSLLLWQPLHANFLLIDEECWTGRLPLPLWQPAHLLAAILTPACLMAWQEPHFLKPGLLA